MEKMYWIFTGAFLALYVISITIGIETEAANIAIGTLILAKLEKIHGDIKEVGRTI